MINEFVAGSHTIDDYQDFVKNLLAGTGADDLYEWAKEKDFFTAPASTKYHGASKGGLLRHSLTVVDEVNTLLDAWHMGKEVSIRYRNEALIAALFHDACKINLYHEVTKWRKDINGRWESYIGYDIDTSLIQIGHGAESLRVINQHYQFMYPAWEVAIAYHMGPPSGYIELQQYMKAVETYPEVLVMHTADMRAAVVKGM